MHNTNRKALLATVLGLAAVAAAVPMVVSGTASAQEGARLCARRYQTNDSLPQAQVIRLIEVSKESTHSCGDGLDSFDPNSDTPFSQAADRTWAEDGQIKTKSNCEKAKDEYLGGRDLTFIGDGWPANDQNDICNNMSRTGTAAFSSGDVHEYWLYDDDGQGNWEFRRG